MTDVRACPRCGRELPDDAPRGLCPACLLGFALAGPGAASDPILGSDIEATVGTGETTGDRHQTEGRRGPIGDETVEREARESKAEEVPAAQETAVDRRPTEGRPGPSDDETVELDPRES